MTNGKSRLGEEHLMTPILRDNALIVRQGDLELETITPIRVTGYAHALSFRSCVGVPMALCEMTVVSLFMGDSGRPVLMTGHMGAVSCTSIPLLTDPPIDMHLPFPLCTPLTQRPQVRLHIRQCAMRVWDGSAIDLLIETPQGLLLAR